MRKMTVIEKLKCNIIFVISVSSAIMMEDNFAKYQRSNHDGIDCCVTSISPIVLVCCNDETNIIEFCRDEVTTVDYAWNKGHCMCLFMAMFWQISFFWNRIGKEEVNKAESSFDEGECCFAADKIEEDT